VKTSQLDDVDRQLLHALVVAPRASFRQLAGALEVSDQTIARRYRRLAETAALRVFGLIDGPRAGWVDWLVRLQATPGSAQRIADTLARRPDTRWVRLLYFDIDIDESVLGVSASVMLWLKIEPASLEAAGRAVAAHPEIPFAAATTGATNLAASAVFRDTRQLYAYLTTRLADLPGLQSVESAPIIGTFKRTGSWEAAP